MCSARQARLALLLSLPMILFAACDENPRPKLEDLEIIPANEVVESPEMYGVVTKFSLSRLPTDNRQSITVTMEMTNVSTKDVHFRYDACFEHHIAIRDTNHAMVYIKNGAPISHCPYLEEKIKPGETITRLISVPIDKFYALPVGTYFVQFAYDRHLMEKPPLEESRVVWSKAPIRITVRE